MTQVNVTLCGLDRLNASFGLALKQLSQAPNSHHQFMITGSDEDRSKTEKARELGAIDQASRDIGSAVQNADLVFISMPYGVMPNILSLIGPELKVGAVVIDLSLLKQPSIEWAKQYFRKASDGQPQAYLVGVTPIINPAYITDPRTDIEAAHADLFAEGTLVLSPSAMCPPDAVQLVTDLAGLMGVKVHFTDPVEHDGIVAATEGLPLFVQVALFQTLARSSGWDDLRRLSNPAFALSTYRMETDNAEDFALFTEQNRANSVRVLESLVRTLNEMLEIVKTGDRISLSELFSDSAAQYSKWQNDRGRNKWGTETEMPRVETTRFFGALPNLLPIGRGKKSDDTRR
jgi:prephenate dehydrogenase